MVRCSKRSKGHNVAKILLENMTLLSVSRYIGMPYGARQWSRKRFAKCIGVILDEGKSPVSLRLSIYDDEDVFAILQCSKKKPRNVYIDEF